VTEEDAKRIIKYRESSPFLDKSDLAKVSGFAGPKGQSLMNKITTKGTVFSIKSVASSGVERIIETVFDTSTRTIKYWKEY
jgi:hypothetical protein